MASHRAARVADSLQRELAQILLTEVKDPRARLATVARVEVSSDLSHARIWVSVLGDEQERVDAVGALERASGFLRHSLAARLRLRAVPVLRFILDRGAEHSRQITDLLDSLELSEPSADSEGVDGADLLSPEPGQE